MRRWDSKGVDRYPALLEELMRRGWSDADVRETRGRKICCGPWGLPAGEPEAERHFQALIPSIARVAAFGDVRWRVNAPNAALH